ncbi:MAG: hypothetical protein V9H26_04230 [Verrucomicrobiota bacterium]|nr:hypothetical protein [Verrucomicrobiota bacterium]MCC6823877.1 hypothetical protein [Limisphaerales bacterium]
MKPYHYILPVLLGFWCTGEKAFARTQPSRESIAAGRLGGVVHNYITSHNGNWPTNWSPLASGLLEENAELVANGKMPIEGTYVFVPTNFPPLDRPDGRVILTRYDSIKEDGLKGRYVVYQDPDQFCAESWVKESDFQALLLAFGGKLQEPDSNAIRIAQAAVASMFAENPDLKRQLIYRPPSEVFAVVAILGGFVVAIIIGWKLGNRRRVKT